MPHQTTPKRSATARVRTAKQRCKRVVTLLPNTLITEDNVERAIVELDRARAELETERIALKVQRARAAKRRIPRGGLKDNRGRKRSVATLPGYHAGKEPANKGRTYSKTPPSTHEVLNMLNLAPTAVNVTTRECRWCQAKYHQPHALTCINPHSERTRALIYVMWRAGLRVACEALRLTENDLYPTDGYLHVERGKNGKARDVAIDDWVWPRIEPWLRFRQSYPAGPLFCVLDGPSAGVKAWGATDVRKQLHRLAAIAKVRRRVAPHQLRHACAVDALDDGVNVMYISRMLGHANLAITSTYLEGLPQSRIIAELRARPVPKVSLMELLSARPHQDVRPLSATPDLMGALAA